MGLWERPDGVLYWEQCNISVVERDSDGNKMTTMTYEKSDGKGIVPYGTELYFSEGKLVEE